MRPFFAFVLLLAGLAFAARPSVARAQSGVEGVAHRAAAAMLKPGDHIALHFQREPSMSGTLEVDERGRAVFPKLGALMVSTVPISALRDTLAVKYAEYLRDADLEIIFLRRVVAIGAVKNPGVYYVGMSSTARDAIAMAGGVTTEGNLRKVSIVRDGQKHAVGDWQLNSSATADLQSGDVVLVDRRSWVAMNSLQLASALLVLVSLVVSLR